MPELTPGRRARFWFAPAGSIPIGTTDDGTPLAASLHVGVGPMTEITDYITEPELSTALPDESILDRRSRAALKHYRERAKEVRRLAEVDLRNAAKSPEVVARELRERAARYETFAEQWDALAAELEAFADQQTPEQGETLL